MSKPTQKAIAGRSPYGEPAFLGAARRAVVVTILLLGAAETAFADSVPPPFLTRPFDIDPLGNSAMNSLGSFRQDGGPPQFRVFLGTDLIPGSLTMYFALPFTDGPGNDFAILTSSQAWGPLAGAALFEFYLGDDLQASFTAQLAPDQLFLFELPGTGLVVNRVVVTNIAPDPPGINNLAAMAFDDAGAAYPIPEPSPLVLLSSGLAGLLGNRWYYRRK